MQSTPRPTRTPVYLNTLNLGIEAPVRQGRRTTSERSVRESGTRLKHNSLTWRVELAAFPGLRQNSSANCDWLFFSPGGTDLGHPPAHDEPVSLLAELRAAAGPQYRREAPLELQHLESPLPRVALCTIRMAWPLPPPLALSILGALQRCHSYFLYLSHGQPQERHVVPARRSCSAESHHGAKENDHASRPEVDLTEALGLARVKAGDSVALIARYLGLEMIRERGQLHLSSSVGGSCGVFGTWRSEGSGDRPVFRLRIRGPSSMRLLVVAGPSPIPLFSVEGRPEVIQTGTARCDGRVCIQLQSLLKTKVNISICCNPE